jgi:hypothetical protein
LDLKLERAFSLWANSHITIESLKEERANRKGKGTAIGIMAALKTLNKESGRMSSKSLSFSETNWGHTSRRYLQSINNLHEGSMDKILDLAKAYVKRSGHCGASSANVGLLKDDEENDQQGNLVNRSDSDSW